MALESKVTMLETIHAWEIPAFGPNGYPTSHIFSPSFTAHGKEWLLLYYPKPVLKENEGYCCFSLLFKSQRQAMKIKYQLSILDREQKIHLSTAWVVNIFAPMSYWSSPMRIKHSTLNNKKDEILNDGKLRILCKILTVFNDKEDKILDDGKLTISGEKFADFSEITESESDKPDNEKNENDFMDYEKYFLSKTFSDMQCIVDEEVFHVHKIILSTRSEVFAAMFAHDMKENNENKVKIENIDSRVFLEVLRYMYTGKVNDIDIIAKDLLVAADKYMLLRLKKICEDHFMKTLSDKNIFEYGFIADTFNLQSLKKKTIMFISENTKALLSKA